MDIMCRLFFILLASFDFGCYICGQTTEMVQNTRHTNTTDHTQQPSHPVMRGSTSDEHTLQTSSPNQDSLKVTTATSVESDISQHTTDLPHRTELSQHAAEYSHQTSQQSQHTTKYSFSASLQSQVTSEFPVSEQTAVANNENPSETHIESSQRTVLVLTNSESSSREKESTDEPRSQSSSESPLFSATDPSSTLFSHSEQLDSSLNVMNTVETRPETIELTDRTFHSTSLQKIETSAEDQTTHISLLSHVTYSIQSQSHHVSDLLPSETGYNTARSDSTDGHIASSTKVSSSRIVQSNSVSQMLTSQLNTTAIVTSPSNESTGVSESSDRFVMYSNLQSDRSSFSDSAAFYTNSTIFVIAPSASTGKVSASVYNTSRYFSDMLQSKTEKPSSHLFETSLQQVINQSEVLIVDSQKTELFNSVSGTEASVLSSSYIILTEVTDTLSPYSKNMAATISLPVSVTYTEQNRSTIFTNGVESSISPSSMHSELSTSSLLHKDISPTSVYQSVNTSLVSDTSDTSSTSIITTVTMKKTSFKPDNITTTTVPRVLEIRDIRFLFEFSGNCHLIQNNSLLFGEFIIGLVDVLAKKLVIPKQKIKPDNFSCGSLKIYVTLLKVPYHYITHILKNLMATRSFIVKIYLQNQVVTFEAVHMKEVKLLNGRPGIFDMPQEGLDKVDIIVIIVACCICGILLSIGGILCIKECYRRKYAQSFDLMEVPHVNLKLEDFTLTRIPRPKTIYNEDNVTIQSYTDSYGQHVARGVDHQSKSNNGVHVHMNKNTDGIVIGVVGTSKKNGHNCGKKAKWRSSASSENRSVPNPSLENLLPRSSDSHTTEGAHNPVFLDDECASCSNDSYSKCS